MEQSVDRVNHHGISVDGDEIDAKQMNDDEEVDADNDSAPNFIITSIHI